MVNIPQILHLYWDKSPMAWLQTLTVSTFHRRNPEWTINVYIPKNTGDKNRKYVLDYTGKDHFHLVESMPFVNIVEVDMKGIRDDISDILRSDILRYNILYEQGGVWSDFDILWLKKIDSILLGEASVCFYNGESGHYSIGVMFSVPGHSLYRTWMDESNKLQKSLETFEHQTFGAAMMKRIYKNLAQVQSEHKGVYNIPYNLIYPYDIFRLRDLYEKINLSVLNENVVSLHWFNGHRLSKDFINNDKYHKCCSMTKILSLIKNEKL